MRTNHRARAPAPAHLGFLLDELRTAGVTTYADLAAALNRQGIRPARGRWTAHDLHLAMRRHRRAHPSALLNAGSALYARRADEVRRVIRRLQLFRGVPSPKIPREMVKLASPDRPVALARTLTFRGNMAIALNHTIVPARDKESGRPPVRPALRPCLRGRRRTFRPGEGH